MNYDPFADLRMRRNNIRRYRRLLETELTELERQYVENRLAEERAAFEKLRACTSLLTVSLPAISPARAATRN